MISRSVHGKQRFRSFEFHIQATPLWRVNSPESSRQTSHSSPRARYGALSWELLLLWVPLLLRCVQYHVLLNRVTPAPDFVWVSTGSKQQPNTLRATGHRPANDDQEFLIDEHMGQVTKPRPPCYPALLLVDSKTRQQDSHSSVTRPIYTLHVVPEW